MRTRKAVANVEKPSVQESVYQTTSNDEISNVALDRIDVSAQAAGEPDDLGKEISWKGSYHASALMILVSVFVLIGASFSGFGRNSGL